MAPTNTKMTYLAEQFGMPLYGISSMPPMTGNWFWVDATNGSDGNTGGPQDPFATLSQAHTQCTSGNNDVVFFTGTVSTTATITWSKSRTHLIGLCAPLKRGKRARISASGTTAFSPLVSVTGSGCWFKDMATFTGFATDAQSTSYCWSDTGGRNVYDNVEFLGFGNTGTSGNTGARSFFLSGNTGECKFTNCVFGVDTIARSVANYTLEITGGSPRNWFVGCEFEMLASVATAAHLYTAASGAIDRYAIFQDCIFSNDTKSTGTAINQVAVLAASSGGAFIMKDSVWWGATAWETSTTNQCFWNAATYATTTPGLMKNNA